MFICVLTPSFEYLRCFAFRSVCFYFHLRVCTSEILFELFFVELPRVCIDFFVGVILVSVAILSYVVLLLAIRGVSGDIGILSLQLF